MNTNEFIDSLNLEQYHTHKQIVSNEVEIEKHARQHATANEYSLLGGLLLTISLFGAYSQVDGLVIITFIISIPLFICSWQIRTSIKKDQERSESRRESLASYK